MQSDAPTISSIRASILSLRVSPNHTKLSSFKLSVVSFLSSLSTPEILSVDEFLSYCDADLANGPKGKGAMIKDAEILMKIRKCVDRRESLGREQRKVADSLAPVRREPSPAKASPAKASPNKASPNKDLRRTSELFRPAPAPASPPPRPQAPSPTNSAFSADSLRATVVPAPDSVPISSPISSPPPPPRSRPPVPFSPASPPKNSSTSTTAVPEAAPTISYSTLFKPPSYPDVPPPAPTVNVAYQIKPKPKAKAPKKQPEPEPELAPFDPEEHAAKILRERRLAVSRIRAHNAKNAPTTAAPTSNPETVAAVIKRQKSARVRSQPRPSPFPPSPPPAAPRPSELDRAHVVWSRNRAAERVKEVRSGLRLADAKKRAAAKEREEAEREKRRIKMEEFKAREKEKKEREGREWKREVRREGILQERVWRENENGGGGVEHANAVRRVTGRDENARDFDLYLEDIPELKGADFVKGEAAGREDDLLQYTRPAAAEQTVVREGEGAGLEGGAGAENDIVPAAPGLGPANPLASPATVRAIKDASGIIERQQMEIRQIQARVKKMQAQPTTPTTPATRPGGGRGMTPDSLEVSRARGGGEGGEGGGGRMPPPPESFNIVFHIYEAKDLPQPLASCNAYCVYRLVGKDGEAVGEEKRTAVCKNTTNPTFAKEKGTFKVAHQGWSRVEVYVYSKNVFISDEFLGKAVVRAGAENEDYEVDIVKGEAVAGRLRGRVDRSWFVS